MNANCEGEISLGSNILSLPAMGLEMHFATVLQQDINLKSCTEVGDLFLGIRQMLVALRALWEELELNTNITDLVKSSPTTSHKCWKFFVLNPFGLVDLLISQENRASLNSGEEKSARRGAPSSTETILCTGMSSNMLGFIALPEEPSKHGK